MLKPNEMVAAKNKNGRVSIRYVAPLKREYAWDGKSRIVEMIPRDDRFMGKFGIYNPATTWGSGGEERLVVAEEQRHFANEEEMRRALVESSAIMDWVYTNDGLVVGFASDPARNQINIEIYQCFVDGRKPTSIEGARPDQIVRMRNAGHH